MTYETASFLEGAGAPTKSAGVEFTCGVAPAARRRCEGPDVVAEPVSSDDAAYYRARAEAEVRRASEALHPAARRAHLEMAAVYQQRACGTSTLKSGNPESDEPRPAYARSPQPAPIVGA